MKIRPALAAALLTLLATAPLSVAAAQTQAAASAPAAELIAQADRQYAALNPQAALQLYERVIATDPKNYEALWKGARTAVDVAEFGQSGDAQKEAYQTAELYARRAIAANPNDAEGHFVLARALGRVALTLGSRDRVKYAGDVRTHALEALKHNPKHAGALHVMGMWNYNVMTLSGVARAFARTFLGGQVFSSASWEDAQRYMEQSVAAEPNRAVHRLDLGKVYAERNNKARAREQWEAALRLQAVEYNDRHYKAQAQQLLARL